MKTSKQSLLLIYTGAKTRHSSQSCHLIIFPYHLYLSRNKRLITTCEFKSPGPTGHETQQSDFNRHAGESVSLVSDAGGLSRLNTNVPQRRDLGLCWPPKRRGGS